MIKGHLWNKLCLFSSSRPGEEKKKEKKKIEGLLNQGVTRLKREEARGLNEVDKAIWKLIPPVERCRAGLRRCNSPHAFIHFSSCWDAEYVRCFSAWSMNWSPRRGARRSPASWCHEGSDSGIHLQWNIICDLPREALEKCVRRQRVILCFYVSEARGDWEYGLDLAYTTDSFITREPLGFYTDGCAFPVCSTLSGSPCGSLRGLCENTYDLAGG